MWATNSCLLFPSCYATPVKVQTIWRWAGIKPFQTMKSALFSLAWLRIRTLRTISRLGFNALLSDLSLALRFSPSYFTSECTKRDIVACRKHTIYGRELVLSQKVIRQILSKAFSRPKLTKQYFKGQSKGQTKPKSVYKAHSEAEQDIPQSSFPFLFLLPPFIARLVKPLCFSILRKKKNINFFCF